MRKLARMVYGTKYRIISTIAVIAIISSGIFFFSNNIQSREVRDRTWLSYGVIDNIVRPTSPEELSEVVASSPGPIAVAGARYSQGGQTWAQNATVIDIRDLNRILDLDIPGKQITVETGITWREILEVISPLGLSIRVMQSYYDFTVGGALSVNAHGRDTTGSIVKTVKHIKVLLPDGSYVNASRTQNPDLFSAAIGGYGACGIIVEATLALTDNVAIRRETYSMSLPDYVTYAQENLVEDNNISLHNANLYPPEFNTVLAVNWVVDEPRTVRRTNNIVRPESPHLVDTFGEVVIRRFWGGKYLRQQLEKMINSAPKETHRNYEIGRPVASLGPWTQIVSSNILQEYFIPVDMIETFIERMRTILRAYGVNMLNASIRYVPADKQTILSYAPRDAFSVVLYINVLRIPYVFESAQEWSQKLIDAALACEGTYYLPYHLFAGTSQFQSAYPQWDAFLSIKNTYDPHHKLHNALIDTYILPQT